MDNIGTVAAIGAVIIGAAANANPKPNYTYAVVSYVGTDLDSGSIEPRGAMPNERPEDTESRRLGMHGRAAR